MNMRAKPRPVEILGARLETLVAGSQVTWEALAERSGISPRSLRNYKLGKGNPELDTIEKLAAAFNKEAWELLIDPVSAKDRVMALLFGPSKP